MIKDKFKIIACINEKLALGNNGDLLYRIPSDLKNFKRMTLDNVVIMGRSTFESLPNSSPLLNRINIIVTRNEDYFVDASFENVHIVHSLEEAKDICETLYSDLDWYIIGGGSIYHEAIEKGLVDTMYITHVNDTEEGDTYFPNVFFDEHWHVFYRSYTQYCKSLSLSYSFAIYRFKELKEDKCI